MYIYETVIFSAFYLLSMRASGQQNYAYYVRTVPVKSVKSVIKMKARGDGVKRLVLP